MIFNLRPQVREGSLELSVQGDIATINGEAFDFSSLNDGDVLSASAVDSVHVIDMVTRVNGKVVLTLLLPIQHGASEEARFPVPIEQTHGEVELPQ